MEGKRGAQVHAHGGANAIGEIHQTVVTAEVLCALEFCGRCREQGKIAAKAQGNCGYGNGEGHK